MAREAYDYVVGDIVSAQAVGGSGVVVTLTGVEDAPLRLYLSASGVDSLMAKLEGVGPRRAGGPAGRAAMLPADASQAR